MVGVIVGVIVGVTVFVGVMVGVIVGVAVAVGVGTTQTVGRIPSPICVYSLSESKIIVSGVVAFTAVGAVSLWVA